jgi:hypothetical protein
MAYVERTGIIFEDKKYSEKCWTHDLKSLVILADLEMVLDADRSVDPLFGANWDQAKNWREGSRYKRTNEASARDLHTAIIEPNHGVLQWIRKHWQFSHPNGGVSRETE